MRPAFEHPRARWPIEPERARVEAGGEEHDLTHVRARGEIGQQVVDEPMAHDVERRAVGRLRSDRATVEEFEAFIAGERPAHGSESSPSVRSVSSALVAAVSSAVAPTPFIAPTVERGPHEVPTTPPPPRQRVCVTSVTGAVLRVHSDPGLPVFRRPEDCYGCVTCHIRLGSSPACLNPAPALIQWRSPQCPKSHHPDAVSPERCWRQRSSGASLGRVDRRCRVGWCCPADVGGATGAHPVLPQRAARVARKPDEPR